MHKYDLTLLTSKDLLKADEGDTFAEETIKDDDLLKAALEKLDVKVTRTNWDNADFNWAETKYVIFRTPWDYFSRFEEFSGWFEETAKVTKYINSYETIKWNIDKHYMRGLIESGINIPPTIFIEPGDERSLSEVANSAGWDEFILKPAISGGAWHTYRLNKDNVNGQNEIYRELIKDKSMLLQQYQRRINTDGEISLMILGGRYSHSILKKAKEGDFRVQQNQGGTVHEYNASIDEITFAEKVVSKSPFELTYARVDIMRDNHGKLSLCELEVFEPELWLRKHPPAVGSFAEILHKRIMHM